MIPETIKFIGLRSSNDRSRKKSIRFILTKELPRYGQKEKQYRNLDAFLSVNDRDILTHAGKISHEMAIELADAEYEKFDQKRIQENDLQESDFDKTLKQLTGGKLRKKP